MDAAAQIPPSAKAAKSAPVAESVRALLTGLIDYAGLFPPAALSMPAAVANCAAYATSEERWMLGRFIVPVARLGDFEQAVAQLPQASQTRWGLSALPGSDIASDLKRILEFNNRPAVRSTAAAKIESIEVKIANVEEIERLSNIVPDEIEAYFEIPLSGNVETCIAAVARSGRRAKIRTGGETADKFPAPEQIVNFIRLCAASGLPFKATAGLHHPIRSSHRLTYQPDSPSGIMHGFLNVFLAAAFLRAGMDPRLAVELVNEQSPAAFELASEGVQWRDHQISADDLSATRQNLAISFGSCSFSEPVNDLRSLRLL